MLDFIQIFNQLPKTFSTPHLPQKKILVKLGPRIRT